MQQNCTWRNTADALLNIIKMLHFAKLPLPAIMCRCILPANATEISTVQSFAPSSCSAFPESLHAKIHSQEDLRLVTSQRALLLGPTPTLALALLSKTCLVFVSFQGCGRFNKASVFCRFYLVAVKKVWNMLGFWRHLVFWGKYLKTWDL